MQWYTLLVKVDPSKNNEITRTLGSYPQNPHEGVTLYNTFHIFGDWDVCLWFSADNNDNAMAFVQQYIAKIPGVIRTQTFPATSIKTYTKT